MPSLSTFSSLICSLPVQQHSIAVDAGFWKQRFDKAGESALWGEIFAAQSSIRISRERLLSFSYASTKQKCAEILLWGYPTDMRGIVSRNISNLDNLSGCSSKKDSWPEYCKSFPKGIGISTVSKLACFHGCKFNGHGALILDSRVRDYIRYLEKINSLSKEIDCKAEQLEFFLFALGDSF